MPLVQFGGGEHNLYLLNTAILVAGFKIIAN